MRHIQHITVEEAASRLNLSIATVRRKCASGEIPAAKVGRSWLIDEASLPAVRRVVTRRSAAASGVIDFDVALTHLRSQDLRRDLWVPDILNFEDDLADRDGLIAAAVARVDRVEPLDPPTSVPVPKSAIFLRNAANLTLPDRLAYHGVILSMVSKIDQQLGMGVFSARISDRADRLLESGKDAWVRWNATVKSRLEESGGWMVETDVTAFFDCILHGTLIQDLESIGVEALLRDSLREMLRTWSATPNTGLPQGPDASRVLANVYFHPIDEAMTAIPDVEYYRFVDDIRLVCASRTAAISALRTLDEECRRRNLHLSTKKTMLAPAAEAIRTLVDNEIEEVNYTYEHLDDPSKARSELKKLFRSAVGGREVHIRRAKYGLYRLQAMRERGVLRKVMSRLEDLAPLGRLVPAYILPWLGNPSTIDSLGSFLHNSERNTSAYMSTWLLAAVLDEPKAASREVLGYARDVTHDAGADRYLRVVAMNVLALGESRRDLDWLRDLVSRSYDPEIVRGAIVALKRVGSLDGSTEKRALRIPGMDTTLRYLKGRRALPSLIFSTNANRVP